ncbi:Lsr2 family DNA-binding protein [Streptomyces albidoflavus]
MSSADLFEDGFPHGTREGYGRGCRGAACPAGVEHGLSCRRAVELSAGDYRYSRMVRDGKTPAEISAALNQPRHEQPAPAARRVVPIDADPQLQDEDDEDDEDESTAETDLKDVTEPKEPTMSTPTDVAKVTKKNPPTPAPASGKTKDELAEIRAWAKENGHDVASHGRVPVRVIAAWEARDKAAPSTIAEPDQVAELVALNRDADGEPDIPEAIVTPMPPLLAMLPSAPSIEAPEPERGPAARTLAEWIDIRYEIVQVVKQHTLGVTVGEANKIAEALLLDGWQKVGAA